jgi:hypothetical protein
VFAQVDPLPGPEVETPISDGNCETAAEERGLDMRGHIVGPFCVVSIIRGVFRCELIEMTLQIRPDRRIGVLVDRQGRGGVLNKKMKYPPTDRRNLREPGDDLGRHEMEPALPRRERDVLLNKRHGGFPLCALPVLYSEEPYGVINVGIFPPIVYLCRAALWMAGISEAGVLDDYADSVTDDRRTGNVMMNFAPQFFWVSSRIVPP